MTTLLNLEPPQSTSKPIAKLTLLDKRRKCLFDPMYLSEALGYNFHEVAHGPELLASIGPAIKESDKLGEALPLFDLSELKSRLILWSRGHYKTSAVALYIVNLILAYPDIRIVIMQSTVKNTKGLLREIKSHFDGTNERSKLPQIFPGHCKTKVRLGKADDFISPARKRTHLKEATVTVASPKSYKAGQHYDFEFFDDLVNEKNYKNQQLQDNLIEEFNHLTPLLEPGGYKTATGTRYSFGDLYGYKLKRDSERLEWAVSIKNCWKDGDRSKGVLFPQVTTADGRVLGFTPELLDSIEKDDPVTFSFQYLNTPIAAGRALFTEELLMRSIKAVPPQHIPGLGAAVLFIDLASSKGRGADNSVIVCGRQAQGQMAVCDIRSGQWDSTFTIANNVIDMVLRHRPTRVEIEGTAAGKYFIDYLKLIAAGKGINVPIEPIKVSNQPDAKDLRIGALEGVLRTGKLFFLLGLPNWAELAKQFCQWQPGYRGRHDDEIDTIALMVQFYAMNGNIFEFRPVQSLLDYITRPTPLPALAERTFVPEELETCGSDYLS
jgi:hypothetical protein